MGKLFRSNDLDYVHFITTRTFDNLPYFKEQENCLILLKTIKLYSDYKFQEKLNYIHNNPLKAGLVNNLDDYPWSSYQNYYLENNSLIEIDY